MKVYKSKAEVRKAVWSALEDQGLARFPFPPTGRIPNFEDARRAAERLVETELFQSAAVIKVNPDSPQQPVREAVLRSGKILYVPTPKLREGFLRFDPEKIGDEKFRDATMISRWDKWAEPIGVDEIPAMDLIVTGCVAVTTRGKRAGKGHGYSDLEYAILQELGHPPPPVVTTVHDIQVVNDFPTERHDLVLDLVVTPSRVVEIPQRDDGPDGIDWALLNDEDLTDMPILAQIRQRQNSV